MGSGATTVKLRDPLHDENQCVQCTSSTQCPVSAQFCRGGECVQCTDSPDCPPSRPLCNDGVCESL